MTAAEIAKALDPKAKRSKTSGSWSCRCPAHEDKSASLSLSDKAGIVLWRCHSGCSQEAVREELARRRLLPDAKPNGSAGRPRTKAKPQAEESWLPISPVPEGAREPTTLMHPTFGKPTTVWRYLDGSGRLLFFIRRFDPEGGRKQIVPLAFGRLNGNPGWHARHPAEPRPLYRLDQLAARPEAPVLVVEGEKAAHFAAALLPEMVVVTWPGGCAAVNHADWSPLKDRTVTIWPDADDPGRKAATDIGDLLLELAAEVRVVDPPPDLPKGWDLADPLPEGLDPAEMVALAERHLPAVERLVEQAQDDPGAPFEAKAIDFLSAMKAKDQAAYERARARLKKVGVRVVELDEALAKRAKATPSEAMVEPGRGRALTLPDAEPWPEPVNGAQLLQALHDSLRRFVVLGDHAAVAVALWVIHTHAHDATFHSARLAITSPTPRCGKSSLMRWLARVTRRAISTSNISPPALFRVIEASYPTLMIDELDQVDPDKRVELIGVINSSHCRLDAQIIRVVQIDSDYEPRAFSTWAPMALAAIGKLPPTWADRSIAIEMTRKLAGDVAEGMRLDRDQGFAEITRKTARWAQDHTEGLRRADPEAPAGLNDRQADNWRILLAIADAAGGEWPARARAAAIALSLPDDDAEVRGVQLLADIKEVFEARDNHDHLASDTIVAALVEMEGRPWAEYRKGRPLTKNGLARLLKPFKVEPGNIRIGAQVAKGYRRDSFRPLWTRYTSATPLQPKESAEHGDFQTATQDSAVAVENPPKAKESAACSSVAVENPPAPTGEVSRRWIELVALVGEDAAYRLTPEQALSRLEAGR